MPICLVLESARRLDNFVVIERTADELQAYRQAVVAKPARYADGRQPADISDSADGVGETERVVQVGFELACRDRKRRRCQNVNLLEQFVHFLLQNAANTLSIDEIRSADLLVDIAANLSC